MALSDRVGKGRSYTISTNQTRHEFINRMATVFREIPHKKPVYSDVLQVHASFKCREW